MIYLFFVVISIVVSAIESISYAGYVVSHISIEPLLIYILSLVFAPYAITLPKKLFRPIYILTFFILTCYFIIIFAESIAYPNFIFSHFHINPYTIMPFILLLMFHVSRLTNISLKKSILLTGLIYLGLSGGAKTFAMIASNFINIIRNPFDSYSKKMTNAYPGVYPVLQTIKNMTPSDATILIPPQGNPWEIEGNAAMVTYFLYPRKVKNLDPLSISELGDKTYLLISKGSWKRIGEVDYGWPKVAVPANQLWEINTSGQILNNYLRDYNPYEDTWDWGLIEVKHE